MEIPQWKVEELPFGRVRKTMNISLSIFDWICVGILAAFVIGFLWVKVVKSINPKD